MSQLNRVVSSVPGSTSNCGSGFDSLGLGLSIYNRITVERTGYSNEGEDLMPVSSMVRETAQAFFDETGIDPFDARVLVSGDVPQARGLGSSVTLRGGILAGLQRLAGLDWPVDRLVAFVTDLEGHPDNASASLMGGFTVSQFGDTPGEWKHTIRFPIGDGLRFVVVSPEFEVLTTNARGMLPERMAFDEVVTSVNGVSCMVAAMASGDYEALRGTVKDFIHEPYRLKGIPGAMAAIQSGIEVGAYTGWLSGSGSSVLCVCSQEQVAPVGAAMKQAFAAKGLDSIERDLRADNDGLTILSLE